MRIILYVFSGTGNTLKVAKLYQKHLYCDVDIYRISQKSGPAPDPNDYDMVGLGYPIHGFNSPHPFFAFCKTLPAVENKKTFIFKTSGEGLHLNDCSSQKSVRLLIKKGYDVFTERHIVMPYNMIYRHTDGMAKQMWIYAKAMADVHCREILEGKRQKVLQPFYKTWYAPIVRIEWPFAHIHGRLFKVDKKKCIDCGRCVSVCPANNITKTENGYKFGGKCELCMGCSFGCPADAIHIGIFKFWKVNGDYQVEKLESDTSIPFPYIDGSEKGIYKLYRKYYRECNERLKNAGVKIEDYIV